MFSTTHCTASLHGTQHIVLDLTDVLRDCSSAAAHMELVYRSCGNMTREDLAAVQKTIDYWVITIAGGVPTIPFELVPYGGGRFARIHGPLRDLCAFVRAHHNAKRCTEATAYAPYVKLQQGGAKPAAAAAASTTTHPVVGDTETSIHPAAAT